MDALKEKFLFFIEHRWMFVLYIVATYIFPAALIIEKTVSVQAMSSSIAVSISGMIVGIVYIAFVSKRIKAKIDKMDYGSIQIIFNGINNCIPFATLGAISYLVSVALSSAYIICLAICVSMVLGMIFKLMDWTINKDYLYGLEIDKLAKKQADIEYRKEQLIEQRRLSDEDGGI